jgi:carbamoylphosphate synthase large subunit
VVTKIPRFTFENPRRQHAPDHADEVRGEAMAMGCNLQESLQVARPEVGTMG